MIEYEWNIKYDKGAALPNVNTYTTYVSDLEVLPHKKVERGWGLRPDWRDWGGAVLEELEAQVSAVFRRVVEQKAGKLEDEGSLHGKQMLDEEGRLVGGQGVQQHSQHWRQQALGVISVGPDWNQRHAVSTGSFLGEIYQNTSSQKLPKSKYSHKKYAKHSITNCLKFNFCSPDRS